MPKSDGFIARREFLFCCPKIYKNDAVLKWYILKELFAFFAIAEKCGNLCYVGNLCASINAFRVGCLCLIEFAALTQGLFLFRNSITNKYFPARIVRSSKKSRETEAFVFKLEALIQFHTAKHTRLVFSSTVVTNYKCGPFYFFSLTI